MICSCTFNEHIRHTESSTNCNEAGSMCHTRGPATENDLSLRWVLVHGTMQISMLYNNSRQQISYTSWHSYRASWQAQLNPDLLSRLYHQRTRRAFSRSRDCSLAAGVLSASWNTNGDFALSTSTRQQRNTTQCTTDDAVKFPDHSKSSFNSRWIRHTLGN